jgi:7-carboxy-7-deazaguanine synthase
MHPNLINEIMHFANENNMFVTLETEGSHFIKTDFPINLISISPKFSNTIPRLGSKTPQGSIVTDKLISQHNKYRIRNNSISKMISYHKDYQIKPVWDGSLIVLKELKDFLKNHRIANNKVYIMPAGQTRQQLILMYPIVMEMCIKEGFNFTGRTHIIAYDDKREV